MQLNLRRRVRSQVRIDRVHVLEYRMPLLRPFGTSRGVTRAGTNFLVAVHGVRADGSRLVGIGEGQPRGRLTGDGLRGSWTFLVEACELIQGGRIGDSPEAALSSVRELMESCRSLASKRGSVERPYRGTLLGLEVALLDLSAQHLRLHLSQLLGERRTVVPVSSSTVSALSDVESMRAKVAAQVTRWPTTRLKGRGELEGDLDMLRIAAEEHRRAEVDKPLWIDVNGAMSPATASAFVEHIAREVRSGQLPRRLIVEQPVPKEDAAHLPVLQRTVDAALPDRAQHDVRIMADESLWDVDDLRRLNAAGGCRAINIKPPKAGGLLAALEIATEALAHDPDTAIYIGGMIGTSDITAWTLAALGRSMPKLDYMTTVPPGNVQARIADPLIEYGADRASLIPQAPELNGIGSRLAYEQVLPYITKHNWTPTVHVDTSLDGRRPNTYEVKYVRGFGKIGLDSHVLELEALRYGLSTARHSDRDFVAWDRDGSKLAFHWTKSIINARASAGISGDKQSTRLLLQRAGVPVPQGRTFPITSWEPALAYAGTIGYPVVLKPRTGTGGIGVVTGIENEEDLRWAIDELQSSRFAEGDFIVEQHIDGYAYRMFVLDGKVLSAVRYEHGSVVGDGSLTVGELILHKNQLRGKNPHLMGRLIVPGEAARFALQKHGLTFDSVPAQGQRVRLTLNPNFAQGGDSVELVSEFHPSLLDAVARGVNALPGLRFGGVDFLVVDHRQPLEGQPAAICEINAHPAPSSGDFPLYGQRAGVSRQLFERCAEEANLRLAAVQADELALRVAVHGEVHGVGYRQWLGERAERFGLRGWVMNAAGGVVEAHVEGSSEPVAALVSSAIRGSRRSRPNAVTAVPTEERAKKGFEIR